MIKHSEEVQDEEKQDEMQEARQDGLRITRLQGRIGTYKLFENEIALTGKDCLFMIENSQIDILIQELQELKQYIS